MKTIIICIALLMVANPIFSQMNNPAAPMTKQDYLKKSKNQKAAAWVFMGGGIGLTILGFQADSRVDGRENTGKTVAVITGVTAITVATILFIRATENKKKAGALSFKMEKVPLIQQRNFVSHSYPALSFRLNL